MKNLFTLIFLLLILASLNSAQTIRAIEIPGAGINDVSANGKYVCGTYNYAFPFRWSEEEGLVKLSDYPWYGEAWGVSNDGRVVGRRYDPTELTLDGDTVATAGYWDLDGSWHKIGNFPGIIPIDKFLAGNTTCISDDGKTIGGYGILSNWHPEAFLWNETDGFYKRMGDNEWQGTRALSLSGDGKVLGGWISSPGITWEPHIWNPDPTYLGSFDPVFKGGDVFDLNHDGSIAFGKAGGKYWSVAMYWTEATGVVNLFPIDENSESKAWCGSDDGSIIGGEYGPWGQVQAFIWTEDTGVKDFNLWLMDNGIFPDDDWVFTAVSAISANGKVICAYGDKGSTVDWSDGYVLIIEDNTPVELSSFTAQLANSTVNLNWHTATETNNRGFAVERKIDESSWRNVSLIDGKGTTTEKSEYSFSESISGLVGEKLYYRLRQMDFDGTETYSNVVEVSLNVPNKFELSQNYPNPFNPTTTITYSLKTPTNVKLTVYNSLGQSVKTLVNKYQEVGKNNVDFDASNLTSGTYIYKLETESITSIKKMTLIK